MSNFYKTLEFPSLTANEVLGNKNYLIEITKVLADQIYQEHVQWKIEDLFQLVLPMCFNKVIFKEALNNYLLSNIWLAIKNLFAQIEQLKEQRKMMESNNSSGKGYSGQFLTFDKNKRKKNKSAASSRPGSSQGQSKIDQQSEKNNAFIYRQINAIMTLLSGFMFFYHLAQNQQMMSEIKIEEADLSILRCLVKVLEDVKYNSR